MARLQAWYLRAGRLPRWLWLGTAGLLYLSMLYLGSVERSVDSLPGREHLSKLYHVLFYGGLAGMLWFGLRRPSVFLVVLLIAGAGALDELNQWFHPFREARASDVLIDLGAGLAAALLLHRVRRGLRQVALGAD